MFADTSLASKVGVVIVSAGVIWLATIIRTLFFHPLSHFPGSKLWAASRLPYIVALFRGTLVLEHAAMHRKYGDVIRVAPDEISFASERAWNDIYVHRTGHQDPAKDPIWYKAPDDMPQNIVTARDNATHARMRKALAPSFTDKALQAQAPTIEKYADLLLLKLRDVLMASPTKGEAVLDIVDWMSFFTVDIIGDLALGESFHCLDNVKLHPWVKTLNSFLRGMVYAAATRWYPLLETALMKMLPKSVMDLQRQHAEFANERVNKRLSLETQRQDFVTPFLESKVDMSLKEIQSNFAILIVAGADATTTSLAGTLLYLVKNPAKLSKLEKEIRSTFRKTDDIGVVSTLKLPYLEAVIHEGLRLSNPVPGGLPRRVPKGGDHYAGQFIPEGTSISVRPYYMGRSESYFYHANEFEPERWLSGNDCPDNFKNDRLGVSQPFSIGHSNCLGKKLAWAEMRLVLARLIFEFDIEECAPEQDWTKLKTFMIIDKGKIDIKLRIRDNARSVV